MATTTMKQVITRPDSLADIWVNLVATEKLDLSAIYQLAVIIPIAKGKTIATAMQAFTSVNIASALDTWYNPATTRSRATKQYITPARVKATISGIADAPALLVHHILARAGLTSYVPEFNVDFPAGFLKGADDKPVADPDTAVISNLAVATQFYTEVFVPEVTRLIADVQSIVRDDLVTRNARYIGNMTYAEIARVFKTLQFNLQLKASGGIATTDRFYPDVYEKAILDVTAIGHRSERADRTIANIDLVQDQIAYLAGISNFDVDAKVKKRKVSTVDIGAVKKAADWIKAYLGSKFAVHCLKKGSEVLGRKMGFLAHESTPATPYVRLATGPLFTAATCCLGHFAAKVQLSDVLSPAAGLITKALGPVQKLLDELGNFQDDLFQQHVLTSGTARSFVKGVLSSSDVSDAARVAYLSEATGLQITDDSAQVLYQLPTVKKFLGQGQTGWGLLTYDRTLTYDDLDAAVADALLSNGVRYDGTPAWPFPQQIAAEIEGVLVDDMRTGDKGRLVQPNDVRAAVYVPGINSRCIFKATEAARSVGLTKTTLILNNQAELQAASQAKNVLLQLAAAVPNAINYDDQLLYAGEEILRIGDSAFCDHAETAMESCGLHSNDKTRLVSYERAYRRCRILTATNILLGISKVLTPEVGSLLTHVLTSAYNAAKKNNLNLLDMV